MGQHCPRRIAYHFKLDMVRRHLRFDRVNAPINLRIATDESRDCMTGDFTSLLIELVEIQTSAENMRIAMSERAYQRADDLRNQRKKWDESGPHAAQWTKQLREDSDAAQAVVARAAALIRELHLVEVERNARLATLARELGESQDRDPGRLLAEMLAVYRRELEVDLPPIQDVFDDLDRRISEIEFFVESRLPVNGNGQSSKRFGRKRRG
jgi:hypothetical protein